MEGGAPVTSDPTVQGTVKTILWHKTASRLEEREDMKVGGELGKCGAAMIQTDCMYI